VAPDVGSESLSFVAQVENENLAEDAILLAHCLADRTDRPWEFNGELRGTHWLKVEERNHVLSGIYRDGKQETAFELKPGESDAVCDKLAPGKTAEISSAQALRTEPSLPVVASDPPTKTWLWVGVGAAAVAGFLFWKSRQPTYSSIQMN
jgi:hypothetical protein